MGDSKEQEDRRGWHMSREISISHMIATLSMVLAGVTGWVKLEDRVVMLEKEQIRVHLDIRERDSKLDKKLDDIAQSVRRVEDKLYDQRKTGQ